MDGAGRLARSQRPQANLKAAALGAAILLREYISARLPRFRFPGVGKHGRASGEGGAKTAPAALVPVIDREAPPRIVELVERYLPHRLGTVATVGLLFGSVWLGIVKGGHAQDVSAALSDTRNALANAAGFRITAVAINGRKQLTQDEVLAIGGVTGRSSLLFLDADTVRAKLKANPWIADATILKLYPGRLQIDIVERTAFALWQQNGRLSVIASDGAVLEPYVTRRFLNLPLVVGKGADTRAQDFLALLDRYPQVRAVTKAAIFVGERRWNLRLKDGLDVRLPENDVGNALAALSKLDKDDKLFSRDIVAVDMRLPDRLIVQLSEEAGKARDELFKDKKSKKKAGDSA